METSRITGDNYELFHQKPQRPIREASSIHSVTGHFDSLVGSTPDSMMSPRDVESGLLVTPSSPFALTHGGSSSNGLDSDGSPMRKETNRRVGSLVQRNLNRMCDLDDIIQRDVDFSRAKILVVEDSPTQRKVLLHVLHRACETWSVSYAISGEDALQKLKAFKFKFDAVLVDENLSMQDGLFGHELVHVMREQFNMLDTVVVACTSSAQASRENLVESGVDLVWSKPPPVAEEVRKQIDLLFVRK
jgi:CheY-like chemotaxis protein